MNQAPVPGQPWNIDEEAIAQAQPTVRGLQIQRYEDLWTIIRGRIQDAETGDRPLDPRFLELGVRVLKEEAALYRLSKPQVQEEDQEDPSGGVDRAALVLEQLADVEARLKQQQGRDK